MDSLCRVCIKRAEKCTSLSSRIEDSSNLSFLGLLNKCTSLNAGEGDSLPQSLCSVCADSMKTFYAFVKLAEKSDIILREALKNLRGKGRYKGSGEISCEEINMKKPEIEEESEDVNQDDSFLCQPSRNSIGPDFVIMDIVKEEVGISESTSIVDLQDAETGTFESSLDHPKNAGHSVGPISLLKNKLGKNEDEIDTKNKTLSEAHCILSNVKKKTDEQGPNTEIVIKQEPLDPQRIIGLIENSEIFCEESTITNEKVEDDSFHCQPRENSTGSPLYILDIVKEEPRVSECTSDRRLTSIDTEYTDSEEDVPIDLLRRLSKDEDETDSQRNSCEEITIRNETIDHECDICGKIFTTKYYLKVHREYHKGITYKCDQCKKEFTHRYSLYRHLKWHTNPTTCEICNKNFTRKSYLKLHMESHKAIQKCDQCGKEYKNSLILRRHMEWHANPKPYKCENCGKFLSNKQNYTRHISICKI